MFKIGRNVNLSNLSNYLAKILTRSISNGVTEQKLSSKIPSTILVKDPLLQSNLLQAPTFERYRRVLEDVPTTNLRIEIPKNILINEILEIPNYSNVIETPSNFTIQGKMEAARLIVIRKRKMKKHKLKKLRKKMKFEWAKVRQRREMRKEKAFQAQLIAQIKDAEKFSAENYVNQKLKEANETPIPRYWKGRRLPQFIIKEKLGLK